MRIDNLIILASSSIKNAMKKIDNNGFRGVVVVDKNMILKGFLSDGDIRKHLLKNNKLSCSIYSIFQKKCFSINKNDIFKHDIEELVFKFFLIPITNKSLKVIDVITKNNYKNYFDKGKSSKYCGMIFAGGKGLRMGRISKVVPKPLLMIDDIPLIEINYKYFKQYNINNIYISLNYKKEMIKSYFVEKNFNPEFIIEKRPLGTAGSLSLIKTENIQKGIICLNCDSIFDIDINRLIKFHENNKFDFTVVTTIYESHIPYGVLEIKNNKLKNLGEKPSIKNNINTGMYICNKNTLSVLKKSKFINMNKFIEILLNRKMKVGVFQIKPNSFKDYGTLSKLNS
tara:strand:- start:876 stop:1898 length:1023 start_codon:yes stop_codon:yes gene_type:complete